MAFSKRDFERVAIAGLLLWQGTVFESSHPRIDEDDLQVPEKALALKKPGLSDEVETGIGLMGQNPRYLREELPKK